MLLSWTEETIELTGGAAAPCATLDAPIEDDAGFDDDDDENHGWIATKPLASEQG